MKCNFNVTLSTVFCCLLCYLHCGLLYFSSSKDKPINLTSVETCIPYKLDVKAVTLTVKTILEWHWDVEEL